MYGEDEEKEKITLDKKTFKTLASDTRIGILKSLGVRRKTLSELAKEYGMSVSTIKEHLDNLAGAELVVQKDEGHKWKYYELTRKGKAVLNPEEKKIWILLSLSALAVLATGVDAVTGFLRNIFSNFSSSYATNVARTGQKTVGDAQDVLTAPIEEGADVATGAGEAVAGGGQAAAGEAAAGIVENTSAATGEAAAGAADVAIETGAGAIANTSAGAPAAAGESVGEAAAGVAYAQPIPWLHIIIIIIFAALAGYFIFRLVKGRKKSGL